MKYIKLKNMMKKWFYRRELLLMLIFFTAINFIHHRDFWREFFRYDPGVEARYGEVLAAEMSIEQSYQNIISGKNPFTLRTDELYPFGTSFTSTDSGNAFYFVLLRNFLSTHQTMLIVSLASIVMASFGMYILIRLLGIDRMIAFAVGLAFGYTTFLLPRAGHLTYLSIYIFPWFFISAHYLFNGKRLSTRLKGSFGSAFFLVMSLYHNSYYFVVLGLLAGCIVFYYLVRRTQKIVKYIKDGWRELLIFVIMTSAFLAPWISEVKRVSFFEGLPETKGWGGAIKYSSDLFGYFVPSAYSKYLAPLSIWMDANFIFARGIFENYSYPGLLIIVTFVYLAYLVIKKKLPGKLEKNIAPFVFATFGLWVLTLGPFLHVFGKWTLGLEEGVKLVIPLPFAVFHYLPFMKNIRSPGRLSIGYIFVSYIVVAYVWQWFGAKLDSRKKKVFIVIVAMIFILDHSISYTPALPKKLPVKHYEIIKSDPEFSTVLEIPSTIRDGFIYFGSVDTLDFIAGQSIHNKPILGGYLGRISKYKIKYYQNNPFLGYIGRLMDENIKNNGGIDRTNLNEWRKINVARGVEAVELLDLSYVLLAENMNSESTYSGILSKIGFEEILNDEQYSLWYRKPERKEFLSVNIGEQGDDFMLAGGWYGKDNGFRWMKSSAKVMFKVYDTKPSQLIIHGESFNQPQRADLYLNRIRIGSIQLTTEWQIFEVKVEQNLINSGLNTLHISTPYNEVPNAIDPNNLDTNSLSAKFSFAGFENNE